MQDSVSSDRADADASPDSALVGGEHASRLTVDAPVCALRADDDFDITRATSSVDALASICEQLPAGYSAAVAQNVSALRADITAADEQIRQLLRALREATEPPTFMGEPVTLKRYAMGFFRGAPAMFEQPDGDYVKWKDVRGATGGA